MDGEDTKLEQALSRARKVLWDLENKRNQRRQELWLQVIELQDRLEGQLREEFDAEHAQLNAIVVDAQAAVDQEQIEKNSKLTGYKAPGTRYWKWDKPLFSAGYKDTKERGRFAVCRNIASNRPVRIRLARFRPTTTGYRLEGA